MNSNFESNSSNDDIDSAKSKLVDIRIVLTNLEYIEVISKAVGNFDLSNFNVNISSIIPASDIGIAKNAISGADLVLVAVSSGSEGKETYSRFKKALKTDCNFIEYLKLPSLEELDGYDYDYEENTFEDEIANSIIRAGLYSISNLSSINRSRKAYHRIREDFDESRQRFDKISRENDVLLNESKSIREKNEKLAEEIKILQRDLDAIKSDYSDLKSRFESIHSKNSLEVYSLMELWQGLFNEAFTEEIYRFILVSTDNFRPKNLMVAQGAICAESKEDALDWLKIIKTAFILNDTNKKELDFNNFESNFKFDDSYLDSSKGSGSFNRSFEDANPFGSSANQNSFGSSANQNSFGSSANQDSFSSSANQMNDALANHDDFNSSFNQNSFASSANQDSSDSNDDFLNGFFDDEKKEDSSDDGFIYNERFEGNSSNPESSDNDDSYSDINVFNIKSLSSFDKEPSNENDDYDEKRLDEQSKRKKKYDDEEDLDDFDLDFDDDYESSPFSTLW